MSGFYKNGVDIIQSTVTTPIGSIIAYMGTTDPTGWVICDGVARSNADGRYDTLYAMGIGTVIASNYTPPNYMGAFLRGTGTNQTYSGPSLNSSQTDSYKSHDHTITDSGHNHGITDPGHRHSTSGTTGNYYTYGNNNSLSTFGTNTGSSTTGITINSSTTGITINSNGNSETRPYNFGVNWIIRY